jgi:D-alanyl-D-alanine carboxypeptidase
MTQVSGLSGYVTTAAGTTYAFSLLSNNHTADVRRVRIAQDRIVRLLAEQNP